MALGTSCGFYVRIIRNPLYPLVLKVVNRSAAMAASGQQVKFRYTARAEQVSS